MAQDTPKDNAGFTLPAPASAPPAADAPAAGAAATTATTEPAPALDPASTTDTSSRDTLIGGVVLLLLLLLLLLLVLVSTAARRRGFYGSAGPWIGGGMGGGWGGGFGIGGAVLLILFVAFFFAKNPYANGLVAKRVPPNKANASGWWLFIFLASLATGVVLAAVNAHKFLAPLFMGPLVLVGLVALLLTFTSSRR